MKKIISVIKREYIQIVKTKGFIIGTILGPVIMAAFIVIPVVSQLAAVKKQEQIGVIDLSQEIFDELDKSLDFKLKDGTRQYVLVKQDKTADIEELRSSLRQKVLRKELSAYILIPEDIVNPQLVFELGDGTAANFSEIWMVNFENSTWDFPQERSRVGTDSHYFFLKDDSVISGEIIGYDKKMKLFVLDNKNTVKLDTIRRIYFSHNVPGRLQNQAEEIALDSGEAAFFLNDGNSKINVYSVDRNKARYVSEHVSDFEKTASITNAINNIIVEKRLKEEGLDPQKISQYIKRVGMKTIKVTRKGEEEEDTGGTFIISYFLVFILYMTLFFYGAIIMRGVIEEKNSRVVEVVLSSLRPFQLMAGKMLGIAAVGLTQYTIWALFGFLTFHYSGSMVSSLIPAASNFNIPTIPPYIFIYFVIFFILGYFLYGTLYATVGSMVNSEKEAQQLLMPISMFLIVPMLLMFLIIRSPDSSLAVILSIFPFFAPILMLMRISILLPPFPQIAASIILLILTTTLMIWISSRIYRVGILMYGKPPNIKEIIKWMKYK